MKRTCNERGIVLQVSEPYIHEHNGKIERFNRTLFEKTRALLYDAKMPSMFWAFAMYTVTYLINRLPTTSLNYSTPYKQWFGSKLTYKYLKVFGCLANALVLYKGQKKLELKSKQMIVVGFTDTGYLLMDFETNTVSYHTHVMFDESTRYCNLVDVVTVTDVDKIVNDEEVECALLMENAMSLTFNDAINSVEQEFWNEAIYDELNNLKVMNTYKVVEQPKAQKLLKLKWVFRKKVDGTFRARLVVLGYTENAIYGIEELYAPVTRPENVKVFLSIASKYGWQVRHADIGGVFLYGKLDTEIFIEPPEGVVYEENEFKDPTRLLLRALYGLCKAPKIWYKELKHILLKIGLVVSIFDATIFVCFDDRLKCILTVYVDDILLTGYNNMMIESVLDLLKENFVTKDLCQVSTFLNVNVFHDGDKFTLSQSDYISSILDWFGLCEANSAMTPFENDPALANDEVDMTLECNCREMIGSRLYIAQWT